MRHHVMALGNARQTIFRTKQAREEFLDVLKRVCDRFDWRVWAYCLMDNHYQPLRTLNPISVTLCAISAGCSPSTLAL